MKGVAFSFVNCYYNKYVLNNRLQAVIVLNGVRETIILMKYASARKYFMMSSLF